MSLSSFLPPPLFLAAYGAFLRSVGEDGVSWRRASCAEEVLKEAHVVRKGVSHERGYHMRGVFRMMSSQVTWDENEATNWEGCLWITQSDVCALHDE